MFQIGSAMRCPTGKFITHTLSHVCFLILLSAATFRIEEKTYPIKDTNDLNDPKYSALSLEDRVECLMKETLRPTNILITNVQVTIMFWVLGKDPINHYT